jgi:hypothetical protein
MPVRVTRWSRLPSPAVGTAGGWRDD